MAEVGPIATWRDVPKTRTQCLRRDSNTTRLAGAHRREKHMQAEAGIAYAASVSPATKSGRNQLTLYRGSHSAIGKAKLRLRP